MGVAAEEKKLQDERLRLSHTDNVCVRNLLDVIAQNIAEEFMDTVKKNPEVFKEKEESK